MFVSEQPPERLTAEDLVPQEPSFGKVLGT